MAKGSCSLTDQLRPGPAAGAKSHVGLPLQPDVLQARLHITPSLGLCSWSISSSHTPGSRACLAQVSGGHTEYESQLRESWNHQIPGMLELLPQSYTVPDAWTSESSTQLSSLSPCCVWVSLLSRAQREGSEWWGRGTSNKIQPALGTPRQLRRQEQI